MSDLELRYPFAPRSRKFFESIPVEAGLASREVVAQAEARLLSALGRVRYEPHMSELIEFSSFFSAALVASQDPVLTSRFSKKEAERAKEFFVREKPGGKVVAMSEFFGVGVSRSEWEGQDRYSLPFEAYLSLVSKYELAKNPKWKLVRQGLAGGVVHVSDNLLNDLFGDCSQAAISEGVRNLRKATFPKQLQGVKAAVIQYVPAQRPRTGKQYVYVEDLLKHPVSDGRHRLVWLVLAPYCLPPDTLIPGDFNTISNLMAGGLVIGRQGQHQRVKEVFKRRYEGKLVVLRASGMLPLRTTPEHPILVVSTYPKASRRLQSQGKTEALEATMKWKPAEELARRSSYRLGDYVVIPRIQGGLNDSTESLRNFVQKMKRPWLSNIVDFPLTRDTTWMLGVYTAEGSNTVHNRTRDIVFSLSADEEEIASRLYHVLDSLGLSHRTFVLKNKMQVTTCSLALGQALDIWCGRGAENKRIPEFLLYHQNQDLLRSFLDGYMQGDGARQARPHRTLNVRPLIEGATSSKTLALQLQLAYSRLGQFLSLYIRQEERLTILGRPTVSKEKFGFVLRDHATRHRHILTEHAILVPISSTESVDYVGLVHNVETPDNAYVAENLVVHNCVNIKRMSDQEAIDRIRAFVSVGGESTAMNRFVEYNVKRARRNGLLPPTFSTLKTEHPDLYGLLPKEVLASESAPKAKAKPST
jgi:intein/homing endonuclease